MNYYKNTEGDYYAFTDEDIESPLVKDIIKNHKLEPTTLQKNSLEEKLTTEQKLKNLQTKTETKIEETINKYQMTTQTVAGWANSDGSLLQPIAQKLQTWRVAVVNKMITIQNETLSGDRDVDSVVFDDEWIEFKENSY